MSKAFAWSFSAIDAFEQCPRRYYETKISKAWPDPPSESANWGKIVHKAFENRLEHKTPLPETLALGYMEPVMQRLEQASGTLRVEYKLAINAQFQPTEFFAKDAWCRAVGDVIIQNGDRAFAADWKTGKFKDGDAQLRLQSAVMFCHYPHLQTIGISYFWLKEKTRPPTNRTFTRDQVPAIWQEFLPRAKRMEQQIADKRFDPKPSGLCKAHCPVLSCEHNGRRK